MSEIRLGSKPKGWPIDSDTLAALAKLMDDGVILGVQQQRWLIAATNALSDALDDAGYLGIDQLSTEPKTVARLRVAIDLGELILCQAEANSDATPEEIERLSDALAGSTLHEVVSDVIEGMRS